MKTIELIKLNVFEGFCNQHLRKLMKEKFVDNKPFFYYSFKLIKRDEFTPCTVSITSDFNIGKN